MLKEKDYVFSRLNMVLDFAMSALAVLESRGIAPRIPALTLWQEVDAAQRSLLAMLAMTASAPSAATA